MASNNSPKKGDCECCPRVDVDVYMMHGNMLMCDECIAKEKQVIPVNSMIEESRKIDDSITMKADIYNAATISSIELRGAIEANEAIPATEKEYAFTKEAFARFKHLQQVIFEKRQDLLKDENELRMWQVSVQTSAGKLRAELREQFKAQDISYQPVTPKSVKPGKIKSNKPSMAQMKEAAAKYKVPVAAVAMVVTARNMSADDAAKDLAQKMGLLK